MFFTNNHGRLYTSVGCSCYEYLVAAHVTSGRIYTPLVVDVKTAWQSNGVQLFISAWEKSYGHIYHSPRHVSFTTENILITNLNEHRYYLNSTKSVIFQIEANCSPFQSLSMLSFHTRVERPKLIYYSLISISSKYYFKSSTLCLLFSSSHIFIYLPL